MLVSIVIPAYNQAGMLRLALHSVLDQTYREFEVVIVDDGSTDDTEAVCRSFSDSRIRYLRQPNDRSFGLGARNRAMLEARGDWIALLDQDDLWHPRKLQAQMDLATSDPALGCIFCWARFIDASGAETGRQPAFRPGGNAYAELLASNRYYASTGLFRRSLLAVAGLPHESAGYADWALWLSLARHTQLGMVEDYLADYRVQAESFQQQQLRLNRPSFARDNWLTLVAQRQRIPADQIDSIKAWKQGMRMVSDLYRNAGMSALTQGSSGSGLALYGRAIAIAPLHALNPEFLFRVLRQLSIGWWRRLSRLHA